MAQPHDLHFSVTQNGVEDPNYHDSPDMPVSSTAAGDTWGQALSQSAHPIVCIFHILFKGLALFLYLFGGWFAKDKSGSNSGANFIVVTVCCILLLSADFWVVKNITGRLLVGLRWWNKVEGDTTRWIFESAKDRQTHKFDSSVFWTVLYVTPVIWICLGIVGLLKFNVGWLITVITATSLSGANVYGYYKCSSEQKAKWEQMMQEGAQVGAMAVFKQSASGLTSGIGRSMLGVITGTPQQQSPPQSQSTFV
jgi:hypothetical protein